MLSLLALIIGIILDAIFGDPVNFPHIIVYIGKLITVGENALRKVFPKTERGELTGGIVIAAALPILTCGISILVLWACQLIHPAVRVIVESAIIWQCLALRSLGQAGKDVAVNLEKGDMPAARNAVSMIVGRDTDKLDAAGVARATVETIAENAGDGVIAPLIYIAIGGAPLGVLYKSINTMDSMLGYKNERYIFFGRAAAKLDDAANFIPSRLAGILMVLAAGVSGYDMKNSWRIFKRDRLNHKSPNSAHTEAACAGALKLKLGGDNYYFGELVHKPTIGDGERDIETKDIYRSIRQVNWASVLSMAICILLRGAVVCLIS